jgi:hypothetical protein
MNYKSKTFAIVTIRLVIILLYLTLVAILPEREYTRHFLVFFGALIIYVVIVLTIFIGHLRNISLLRDDEESHDDLMVDTKCVFCGKIFKDYPLFDNKPFTTSCCPECQIEYDKESNPQLLPVGTKVKVWLGGCNASTSNMRNELNVLGVYSIENWQNQTFTIGDKFDRYSFNHDPKIKGAYLLLLNNKKIGFVYDYGIKVIVKPSLLDKFVQLMRS